MEKKMKWRVEVDTPAGFGMGFITITFDGILSTSEQGAKKQVRKRLRERGLRTYSAVKHPIRVTQIYTEEELLHKELIERSEDFGTTIQNLVKMCIEDAQTTEELKILLNDRLESLADQCYEMIEQI